MNDLQQTMTNHFYTIEMVKNASTPLNITNQATTITICKKSERVYKNV